MASPSDAAANRARARSAVAPLCLAALATVAQLAVFDRNFVSMDEGHLALTASRMLDGDLLYRDIHTGIFPGIYAISAALFGIFGEELLVTRIAEMGVNLGTVLLLWFIGLRIVPPRWAMLPPILFIALIWIGFPVLSMFNYSALAGMLALAALLHTLRYLERGARGDGLAIGLVVGLCLFTKQNYGGLAAIGITAGILLGRRGSPLGEVRLAAAFAPIVTSGAGFLALAVGALALTGTLAAWVDSTLLSLVGSQLQDFNNPIPPIFGAHPVGDVKFTYLYIPSSLFDYLVRGHRFWSMPIEPGFVSVAVRLFYGVPIAGLMVALVLLALASPAQRDRESGSQRAATAVVAFAVAFFFGILPSAVFSHLVYVLAPVLLLFAWIGHWLESLTARWHPGARHVWFGLGSAIVTLVLLACAAVPGHVRRTYSVDSGLPHVAVAVAPEQAAIHAEALAFIERCAAPGAPIFTLPILPILYLASGHPNPVKWDLLIPGAIDQQAIIRALEREEVACIVRQRDMNPEFPPLEHLYPELDEYIKRNYRRGRRLAGGDQLWFGLQRSTPFPGSPDRPKATLQP